MKLLLLCIILCGQFTDSCGQDKKDLAISLSTGRLNSPYYNNAHARGFFGIGFDYFITRRHIISANYLSGQHDYFDDILSNAPASTYIILPKKVNANAAYNMFSVTYKYKLIDGSKFSVFPGVGAGVLTHTRDYPHIPQPNTLIFRTSSWSDLVFPVTLDINYQVLKKWQIGLTGGFLIAPDYPVLGLHAGPRLAFLVK